MFSKDFDSFSITSRHAPKILPVLMPSTKSDVFKHSPLDVLMRKKGFLQLLIKFLFIN